MTNLLFFLSHSFLVPDMSITGHLSTVSVNLDLSQFSLIMGMLGENLGEPLDVFQAPSTVIVDPLVFVRPIISYDGPEVCHSSHNLRDSSLKMRDSFSNMIDSSCNVNRQFSQSDSSSAKDLWNRELSDSQGELCNSTENCLF